MKRVNLLVILGITLLLAGCSGIKQEPAVEPPVDEPVFLTSAPGEYDSFDRAVVLRKSDLNNTITFFNYELNKSYTLEYDSVTKFYDKYGSAMIVSQVNPGEIVEVKFLKSKKLLTDLKVSSDSFLVTDVTGFSVDTASKVFTYKEDTYKITDATVILQDKKKITFMELDPSDLLTISGMGSEIYSICVNKGHGTLAVKNEDPFLDGTLEINNEIIKIAPKMKLTLREGKYTVKILKERTEASKEITIEPGKNTTLDFGDIEIVEARTGKVLFDISPSDATLYIDDKLVDSMNLLVFDYGVHHLFAKADGYESVSKYFNVGEEMATLSLELEKKEDKADSSNTTASEEGVIEGSFIFVNSLDGAEIYFDGYYIGKTTVSIPKKSGSHTITVEKSGYMSKTYNVMIDSAPKDVYYTFDEMTLQTSLVSGNDVSSNG